MVHKTGTVTISLSTNPAVEGRYFVDVRDTTGGRNRQITTRTRNLHDVIEFLDALKASAIKHGVTLVVTDTTDEVHLM